MKKGKQTQLYVHTYYGTIWYLFEQIDIKDIKELFPEDWKEIGRKFADKNSWHMIPINSRQ